MTPPPSSPRQLRPWLDPPTGVIEHHGGEMAKQVSTGIWIAGVGFFAFGLSYVVRGYMVNAAANLLTTAVLFGVYLWSLRPVRPERLPNAARIAAGAVLATLTFTSLFSGQGLSGDLWVVSLCPLFLSNLLEERETLGWTIASLLVVVGVHVSGTLFAITPEYRHSEIDLLLSQVLISLFIITAQRRAQAGMAKRLQELLASRALVASQARELQVARDAALEGTRSKSTFLATMSHELRTPLHGMLGAVQVLGDMELGARQRELLGTARQSGELLLAIVNDVLDFSKIEAGQMRLERRPFDLESHIRKSLNPFQFQAERKGLAFRLSFDPRLPSLVVGDQLRLRQVLNNLVGNSIKFTARGSVEVRVAPSGRGSGRIRVSVIDTGVGIAPERQAELFVAFHQADASTSRRFGGTGLGLAISQRLAELMHGQIEVESEFGKGAAFHVDLSLPEADADDEPSDVSGIELPAAAAEGPVVGKAPPTASARVLLVEDNAINRQLAERMLERLGHQVVSVEDGEAAVARVLAERFDVVLMDVRMAGIDGLEATRRIRTGEKAENRTRIVALTADVTEQDRRACLDAGMDSFLGKPFDLDQLASAVVPRTFVPRKSEPVRPATDPSVRAIDLGVFDRLRVVIGEGEALTTLVEQQQSQSLKSLDAMGLALEQGRRDEFLRLAHGLKGSSAMFGVHLVMRICADLEQAARKENGFGDDTMRRLMQEARAAHGQADAAFKMLLGHG